MVGCVEAAIDGNQHLVLSVYQLFLCQHMVVPVVQLLRALGETETRSRGTKSQRATNRRGQDFKMRRAYSCEDDESRFI